MSNVQGAELGEAVQGSLVIVLPGGKRPRGVGRLLLLLGHDDLGDDVTGFGLAVVDLDSAAKGNRKTVE